MKNKLTKYLLLSAMSLTLVGCNAPEEKPITNKDESTIIKNAKNTDEYMKKQDYKSIAYAFIYNIKDGLSSYESETNGSVKAKVLFFDYDIKFNSLTYKKGNAFYAKDHSTSTFVTIKNEFYMVDKEKILVSREENKYDVYTCADFQKTSYSMNQYTVMGYVFNDESILKTELVSDKEDVISIKYTLDNDLATNLVKVDMKNNGDLTSYPSFKKVEVTLTMKKDFTPISYSFKSTYDAAKPVIGASEVTQECECVFSKVNEEVTIPNEAFLADKLGAKPSEWIPKGEERDIKTELLESVKNLDFAKGVGLNGNLTLNLTDTPIVLTMGANIQFDIDRISKDKIFDLLSFYAKLEGDSNFNSLISMVKMVAGDKLGEYKDILDNFKSVEIVYDGQGSLYLVPTNQSDLHTTIVKVKITDILDLLLKQINVYNLVQGLNKDVVTFKKNEGSKEGDYQIEISLNEEIKKSLKDKIDTFLADSQYALIGMLLGYKDFDGLTIKVNVENNAFKNMDAALSYVKKGNESEGQPDEVKTLLSLHLDASNQTFNYAPEMEKAKKLYDDYVASQPIKSRFNNLLENVYVNKAYLANVKKALEEYNALSDTQKAFVGTEVGSKLGSVIESVENILTFLDVYKKYDLTHLTNADIFALATAYSAKSLDSSLLKAEIGEEDYSKLNDLGTLVDYSGLDSAITKMNGDDENAWGLTEKEIKDVKLILDISSILTSTYSQVYMKLLAAGKTMTVDDLKVKINNLYNKLNQD